MRRLGGGKRSGPAAQPATARDGVTELDKVEDLLREGVLAPLVGIHDAAEAQDKKGLSKILGRGGLPRFSAAQLWAMGQGQVAEMAGEDTWAAAVTFVRERAASLDIDRMLQMEAGGPAARLEILLIGRAGSGKRSLLDALQRVYPAVPDQTNLDKPGLRQLCITGSHGRQVRRATGPAAPHTSPGRGRARGGSGGGGSR